MNNKEDDFKKLKMLYTIREKMLNIQYGVYKSYSKRSVIEDISRKLLEVDRSDIKRQLERKIIELEVKIVENY